MYHIKINKLVLGREPRLNQNNISNQMLPLVLSGFQTHHLAEDGSSVMKDSGYTMLTTWSQKTDVLN